MAPRRRRARRAHDSRTEEPLACGQVLTLGSTRNNKSKRNLSSYRRDLRALPSGQKKDLHSAEIARLVQLKIRNSSPSWFLRAAALEPVYRSLQKSRCTVLERMVVRQVRLRPPGVRRFPPGKH